MALFNNLQGKRNKDKNRERINIAGNKAGTQGVPVGVEAIIREKERSSPPFTNDFFFRSGMRPSPKSDLKYGPPFCTEIKEDVRRLREHTNQI